MTGHSTDVREIPTGRRYGFLMHELLEQWTRLTEWLHIHAPVTVAGLNPPAAPSRVKAAEHATGQRWAPELHAWFGLHNGSDQGRAFPQIFPGFRPITLAELEVDWRSLVSIWSDTAAEFEQREGRRPNSQPAGSTAFTYLPSFIPIAADDTRERLFVDTRPGSDTGCVIEFSGEGTDDGTSRWPSIASMLRESTDALQAGTACRGWVPYNEEGQLYWDYP